MPGITGIISKTFHEKNIEDLHLMVNTMMYEPHFTYGTYINEQFGVYLGWVCHKDSFVDCMPIWNEEKNKCLLFYGENFADKKFIDLLLTSGHKFSTGNASYLIHLFEEKGHLFFTLLNGFFNGVLIDLESNEVTIFNDRYGMQRLYYYENNNAFLFSAEAKSLLKVRTALREIVPESIGQLISMGCVLENDTLFKNIYLLPRASLWKFKNGNCNKKDQYFNPEYWENQSHLKLELFYNELKETFLKILPRYLTDKRSIAMSLTGGLDTRDDYGTWQYHS